MYDIVCFLATWRFHGQTNKFKTWKAGSGQWPYTRWTSKIDSSYAHCSSYVRHGELARKTREGLLTCFVFCVKTTLLPASGRAESTEECNHGASVQVVYKRKAASRSKTVLQLQKIKESISAKSKCSSATRPLLSCKPATVSFAVTLNGVRLIWIIVSIKWRRSKGKTTTAFFLFTLYKHENSQTGLPCGAECSYRTVGSRQPLPLLKMMRGCFQPQWGNACATDEKYAVALWPEKSSQRLPNKFFLHEKEVKVVKDYESYFWISYSHGVASRVIQQLSAVTIRMPWVCCSKHVRWIL